MLILLAGGEPGPAPCLLHANSDMRLLWEVSPLLCDSDSNCHTWKAEASWNPGQDSNEKHTWDGGGGGGFQVRWSHRMDELQADASRKGTSIL